MTTRLFDSAHVAYASFKVDKNISQLVKDAKKNAKNRVYYHNKFEFIDIRDLGIIQSDEKSIYDQVTLDESANESIEFYGFDQAGSYFSLSTVILSLYPNVGPLDESASESKWRLARVNFSYINKQNKLKYSYKCEQLIDYESKRKHSQQYDTRNVWKIGSISIETVSPFSLTRILFNGLITRSSLDEVSGAETGELVSAKLTISTHPTSDKFDYQDRFDPIYLSERLTEQISSDGRTVSSTPKSQLDKLLGMFLEDRIDQTMMFQGHLEFFAQPGKDEPESERFIMWGAKLKRFIDPRGKMRPELNDNAEPVLRETLVVWNECGLKVHMTRPLNKPNVVYGFINNAYEYSSPINSIRYMAQSETDDQQVSGSCLSQLNSFQSLKQGAKFFLKGHQKKQYTLEILKTEGHFGLFQIDLNGFKGWAMVGNNLAGNLDQQLAEAQHKLWALSITNAHESQSFSGFSNLASERLLGGKGNSLIELDRMVRAGSLAGVGVKVSVPRGIVVTCLAYRLWLNSDPMIREAIAELDVTRRTLAASSVNLNPMSEKFMSLAEKQQRLREQCQKTHTKLNSCPLPVILRNHLRSMLLQTFDNDEIDLGGKLFAVRSSAVGEDSLETSAAGQMRTILDARGLDSICRSIVDCWSSQFELEALTYKSQNGLPLNLPMAVVIQELIGCRAAGVAATCDPLTGSKDQVEILANAGQGEGVVSGGEADTIRVSLKSLEWHDGDESFLGSLSVEKDEGCIELVGKDNNDATCCLTSAQIVALANLLIDLGRVSQIREREIEWGITLVDGTQNHIASLATSSSSSSSSSSNDENGPNFKSPSATDQQFHIHLLQSRPLTHLTKLSSREIQHELDYGFITPLDIVTRANLGEVMPGVMSPLALSYFLTICPIFVPGKPFEDIHTLKPFTAAGFGSYGQMMCMVLTYSDVINKFISGKKDQEDEDNANGLRVMIGTEMNESEIKNLQFINDISREKVNPQSPIRRDGLLRILFLDAGGLHVKSGFHVSASKKTHLEDDLASIDELIERFKKNGTKLESSSGDDLRNYEWHSRIVNQDLATEVRQNVLKLFDRLCKHCRPITSSWQDHMMGTILSMAFNMICLQVLNKQPAYASLGSTSSEVLNDFSILVRGGPKTESGDISQLLKQLIEALEAEGKLEQAKQMGAKELYQLLATPAQNGAKSVRLYEEFIKKNGHRAFKEFDYATATWADDPSYIIKSLAVRLKQYDGTKGAVDRADVEGGKLRTQTDEILAKVVSGRALLVAYALPRARNAIVRREKTKSRLIKAIDKYRKAFRHLGGLLCLEGRLPSAELVFQLTIEELARVVHGKSGELAGILYKARRRQQLARKMDRAAYPRPTLDFSEMVQAVQQFTEASAGQQTKPSADINGCGANGGRNLVRGMTSCTGCVTGRACVVSSLDDMDQVEPNDILITYSIDISWSVYFFTLAGIVTEVGGIVSHGAVVAREYGIPTLCTAVGACSVFKTGQIVTLDANRGTCYLAAASEQDATTANGDQK